MMPVALVISKIPIDAETMIRGMSCSAVQWENQLPEMRLDLHSTNNSSQ